MLRVGLTGGIGSGKSTAAAALVRRGAVLVDSDLLAREVVAPGTEGLAEIVAAFGPAVLGPGSTLDRPALAAVVFGDPAARERLNGIVHPRVRRRAAELIAAAPADAVVVQDVPLLVETGMAPLFPLVVVVHAEAALRVRRLVAHRGMAEADALARIAAQADDAARRRAADVWLDNSGGPAALDAAVGALWAGRLVPFEENLRRRRVAAPAGWQPVDPDPEWPRQAARLAARVAVAAGGRGRGVAHVGATAIPGLAGPDVIDLQLGVDSQADADALGGALAEAGFPAGLLPGPADPLACADPGRPGHASADPGRPARLHVRPLDSPRWRRALLLRDWLLAAADARQAGAELVLAAGDGRVPELRDRAVTRAEAWAASRGWAPSLYREPTV